MPVHYFQGLPPQEQCHEPFEISVPGPTLRKLAPLLYVMIKLMQVASLTGGMAGLPLPHLEFSRGGQSGSGSGLAFAAKQFGQLMDESTLGFVMHIVAALETSLKVSKKFKGPLSQARILRVPCCSYGLSERVTD